MQEPTLSDSPSRRLSRRHAFKIAGLATAAVALRDRVSLADAPATAPATSLPQGAGFYRTQLGEMEVTVISDGGILMSPPFPTFGLNAGEDAVNNALRADFIEPAEVTTQVNALLVRNGRGGYTLIDSGAGKLFGPATGFVRQNLAAAGIPTDAIDTVVFTHLHPDHVGGAIDADGRPVFAKAKHFVHKIERDFWAGESPDLSKSGVGPMAATLIGGAKKAIAAFGDKLQTFDGDEHDIAPGITAVLLPGHTPGHCLIRLSSGGKTLLHLTDAAHNPTLSFGHPDWYLGFDTDRDQAVAARKKIYAKVAADRTLLSGSHLPFPSLGHLKASGDAYAWVPAPWRWA